MSTKHRILIVEDQRLIAADLENTLEKLGYEVVGNAAEGAEAVEKAFAARPDLILMDIRLRGPMDGIQAAERVRARADTPIIYLTAYADEETIARAKRTSPFGYLVKPFNERELRAAIEVSLYRHSTERTLAMERARRQAAEEFKLVFDSVKEYAIFMLDTSGHVASWNDGAKRILGYASDDILGKHISSFYAPEDVASGLPDHLLERATRDGRAEFEGWRVRKDGSRFWGNVVVAPIRTQRGELHGFANITHDLSERRHAERERDERVMHMSAIVSSALDCIITLDAQGRIVEFNPAAEQTFGYTREEAIGREMAELILPERLREDHRAGLAAHLRTGDGPIFGRRVEMAGLKKDGTQITLEQTMVSLPGAHLPVFTVFLRDITDQKRALRRRHFLDQATVALASSLELPTVLQKAARIVVPEFADWCLIDLAADDAEGLTQVAAAHATPAKEDFARQLGRIASQPGFEHGPMHVFLTGQSEIHPELEDVDWAASLLGAGYPEILRQLGVYSYLCVPIRFRTRTLGVLSLLRAEPPRRYEPSDVVFAEELARRVAMAVDNAQLYEQAQEAVRARDEFLQIASHELKTPLTPLQLQLDTLHRAVAKISDGDGSLTRKLETAARQTTRLSRLVDSLLDVSRITAGRVTLDPEPLDLADLIHEVIERFRPEARKAETDISVAIEHALHGRWDRLRLEQILSNLIANAIKYGAGKPVEVRARVSEGTVRISVTDHGIGIDKDALERIFGRFERAVSTRHFGGLGLGLFIARQFAEAQGGHIVAHSEPGAGSTFTLILPLQATSRVGARPSIREGP